MDTLKKWIDMPGRTVLRLFVLACLLQVSSFLSAEELVLDESGRSLLETLLCLVQTDREEEMLKIRTP